MSESKWKEMMNYANLEVFANDGTLDRDELGFLMGLALQDEVLDDREKTVLKAVFDRVPLNDVDAQVKERMQAIREKHGL